jgi:hypothetical protein
MLTDEIRNQVVFILRPDELHTLEGRELARTKRPMARRIFREGNDARGPALSSSVSVLGQATMGEETRAFADADPQRRENKGGDIRQRFRSYPHHPAA